MLQTKHIIMKIIGRWVNNENNQKQDEDIEVRQAKRQDSWLERTHHSKASFPFLSGAPNMCTTSVYVLPDGTGRHKWSTPVFTGTLLTSICQGPPDV